MTMRLDRVEMNSEGAKALLNDPGVAADLLRRGGAVASAAGPGFVAIQQTQRSGRAAVVVVAQTAAAKRAQARDRVLNTALDAGRT